MITDDTIDEKYFQWFGIHLDPRVSVEVLDGSESDGRFPTSINSMPGASTSSSLMKRSQ